MKIDCIQPPTKPAQHPILLYNKNMNRVFATILLVIASVSDSICAEEHLLPAFSDPPSSIETIARRFSMGRSAYDQNFLTGPLKDLAWNERLHQRDSTLGASIVDTPNFELGLQGGQRLGRYEQSEQTLSGLGPLEDSYELGLFSLGRYGDYLVGTRFSKDVAHGHQGILGEFMAGYEKRLSEKLDLSFGVGTTWADDSYMTSYYGVNAAQSASSGLPQYTPNGGLKNASLTVSACYQLSDYWSLGAQVGYMRMLGHAAESPTQRDQELENIVTGFQLQYRLRGLTGTKFRNLLRPACNDY
jgi:outer membrane scaffolding protein for murein synthesis (MipA/OmpV family)